MCRDVILVNKNIPISEEPRENVLERKHGKKMVKKLLICTEPDMEYVRHR